MTLAAPEEFGGQGLPFALAAALWTISTPPTRLRAVPNVSMGAIEALDKHGVEEFKQAYLGKMVSANGLRR